MAAGERSILLRGQLAPESFPKSPNGRLEAAFTGTLEAYLHKPWINS